MCPAVKRDIVIQLLKGAGLSGPFSIYAHTKQKATKLMAALYPVGEPQKHIRKVFTI